MRMKPVRAGIVGCGYWGSKHLRVFNELPDCEVAALCETSEINVARQPRAFLPERVTASYEDFLNSPVEAVVIATPAATHYQLALEALSRDKHVLVEKPFTTRTEEAVHLIRLAESKGLTLMVGHTYVYHPAVAFIRDLVQSGELGPLYYIHAARLNFGLLQPDVDVMWDLAPHDLSILLHILDQEPVAVAARGTAHVNPNLVEVAHLDIEFLNSLLAHIYVSWMEPTKVRRLTLVGGDKTVVFDDTSDIQMISVHNQGIQLHDARDGRRDFSPQYLRGDVNIPFLANSEALKVQAAHFLHCLRTGQRPLSDGSEGLKIVRILESAEKSLRKSGFLELLSPIVLMGHDAKIDVPPIQLRASV